MFGLFLRSVRAGERTPDGVAREALNDLRAHLRESLASRVNTDTLALQRLISVVLAHPSEALLLAGEALAWESLPGHERTAIKDARADHYRREWMEAQPPSEKQLAFLKVLGYLGPVQSKQHAGELIDQLRGGNPHGS